MPFILRAQTGSNKKAIPDNLTKYNDNTRKLKIKAKEVASNTGDTKVDDSKERKAAKKISGYSGDIVSNESKIRKKDKEIGHYSGDMEVAQSRAKGPKNEGSMVLVRGVNMEQQMRMKNYSGDILVRDLNKRDKMRREKGRKIASYEGDILVSTLEARDRKIRKKSKQMANFEGDIIVKRVKKGMHPSAVYRGGNVKNSYAAKERYRKRMLKKYGKNDGIETPNYMKKKEAKPKYDKRESEIWR